MSFTEQVKMNWHGFPEKMREAVQRSFLHCSA